MKDRAILFDWGGTLMESMPYYLGPGSGWSQVPPVEGAAQTLQLLRSSWLMGLASNASESEEGEIRKSLECMGVGLLLDRIYTYRSIGRPKPWPEFWRHVLADLGLAPGRVVMVGDDFMGDVWGATNAGMSAVWLNLGSADVRSGDRYTTIHRFADLPQALRLLGFD